MNLSYQNEAVEVCVTGYPVSETEDADTSYKTPGLCSVV
jgi:hypothetical protein